MLLQARRVAEESLLVKSIMHVASRKQTHGHGRSRLILVQEQ